MQSFPAWGGVGWRRPFPQADEGSGARIARRGDQPMGTISTGTGLISGLDIQGIVKQLMDIESRPLLLLQQRIAATKQQQTAYMTLSATLLAAKASAGPLSQLSL